MNAPFRTHKDPSRLSLGETPQDWILPISETQAAMPHIPPPPPGIILEVEMDQFCDADYEPIDAPMNDDAPENHDTTMMVESAPVTTEPRRWDSQPSPYTSVPFDELLPPVSPNVVVSPPPSLQGFAALPNDHRPMGSLGMAQPLLHGWSVPNDDPSIDVTTENVGNRWPSQSQPSKSASVSVVSWADSSYNNSTTASQDHSTVSVLAPPDGMVAVPDNPHKRRFSVAVERPTALSEAPVPISGSILIPDQHSKNSTCSGLTSDAPPVVSYGAPAVVPKSELHRLYGQPPRRKVITSEYFHTWHDEHPSHVRKWTALLVCPITAELFFSGRYAQEGTLGERSLVWFTKKGTAEHAAAARAYDCFLYRDRMSLSQENGGEERKPIGLEAPYFQPIFELAPDLGIPSDIRQKIMTQQEDIRSMHGLPSLYR